MKLTLVDFCSYTWLTIKFCAAQDDASASNGNKDQPCFDGVADVEVERRLKVITSLQSKLC